jgi:hypothetical protein
VTLTVIFEEQRTPLPCRQYGRPSTLAACAGLLVETLCKPIGCGLPSLNASVQELDDQIDLIVGIALEDLIRQQVRAQGGRGHDCGRRTDAVPIDPS